MKKCAVCGKDLITGHVVEPECLDKLKEYKERWETKSCYSVIRDTCMGENPSSKILCVSPNYHLCKEKIAFDLQKEIKKFGNCTDQHEHSGANQYELVARWVIDDGYDEYNEFNYIRYRLESTPLLTEELVSELYLEEPMETSVTGELEFTEKMLQRRDELDNAVWDCVKTLVQDEDLQWDAAVMEPVIDSMIRALNHFGYKVWNPGIVTDDNGKQFYTKYDY